MALHDTDNTTGQEQPQPQAQKQNAQYSGAHGASTPAGKAAFSFGGSSMFAAPISRSMGNEQLNKIAEALGEIYKDAEKGINISLLLLDRNTITKLAFSAIVVCLTNQQDQRVASHTLLIEATGERVMPVTEHINGRAVVIDRVASDAVDVILRGEIDNAVARAFPGFKHHYVEATCVPVEFDVTNRVAVHKLAFNAAVACNTELVVNTAGFKDFDISTARDEATLAINLSFGRVSYEDAVGSPVRSDVQIEFFSKTRQNDQTHGRSLNSAERDVSFSRVHGYIDLVWDQAEQPNVMAMYAQQAPVQPQLYVANLVITAIDSIRSMTPSAILMAILTAKAAADNNNWIQAFTPQVTMRGETDLNDIGAIGIEANIERNENGFGSRFATQGDNFRLPELGQLLATFVRQGLAISLDVVNSGPQSWSTSPFAAAARGNQDAMNIIYQAANELTGGRFAAKFPRNTPMFMNEGNIVHIGTYHGRDGELRDIRDISYLPIANIMGDRDPSAIRAYSDTYNYVQEPIAIRLMDRKRILSGITNDTVVITNTAERVTFSGAFMAALSEAAKEAGLVLAEIRTPRNASDFNNRRHGAGWSANALVQPGQSFNTAGFGTQSVNSFAFGGGGSRFSS